MVVPGCPTCKTHEARMPLQGIGSSYLRVCGATEKTHRSNAALRSNAGRIAWEFVAARPEIDGERQRDDGNNGTEFIYVPGGLSGVARQRSEDALNIKIVAGMEERARPETARFKP